MAHSALLAGDAGISQDLSALAAAGLQAVERLRNAAGRSPGWVEQQTALLERAKLPHGELLLSVEPSIRKLIEAAR